MEMQTVWVQHNYVPVEVLALVQVCIQWYSVAGVCSAVRIDTSACVVQVGSSETLLTPLTVSVARSKLPILSLVLAPVV